MSVAVQTANEKIPRSAEAQLAWGSLLGALFVLGSCYFILSFLPTVWHQMFAGTEAGRELLNPFLSTSLLLLVSMAAIVGIGFLGRWLDENFAQKGMRAGSFFGAVLIFFVIWISLGLANFLEVGTLSTPVNITLTVVVAAALLFGLSRLFLWSGFRSFLLGTEEQGWFAATAFKPNQGHKVRRATIAGILAIGICGIYTAVSHKYFGSGLVLSNDWMWQIPFSAPEGTSDYRYLPLLYKVHLMGPLLLSLMLVWFAWRIVNWPAFADFLIATEAEINKVSWTTRKRLVADTIVVLTTVFLLTGYLFVVDLAWIQILNNRFIQVLNVDIRGEQAKQFEKTLW